MDSFLAAITRCDVLCDIDGDAWPVECFSEAGQSFPGSTMAGQNEVMRCSEDSWAQVLGYANLFEVLCPYGAGTKQDVIFY